MLLQGRPEEREVKLTLVTYLLVSVASYLLMRVLIARAPLIDEQASGF